MKKIIAFVAILFLFIGYSAMVSAESITDPSDDVAHWNYTETAWGWNYNIGSKPDVDITELKQRVSDNKMIIEIVVAGSIQTSELYAYSAWFNTSDSYYMFFWSNGQGGGLAANIDGGFNFTQADVTVSSPNTLTASFNLIGDSFTAENFWGYAFQYSTLNDAVTAEWWGDWVPNEESPFYGQDTEDPDDASETDETEDTGDTSDAGDINKDESISTPGFEIIALFVAMITFIYIEKRKR